MIRKRWTCSCIIVAVLVIVVPLVMVSIFSRTTIYNLTRSVGLWQDDISISIWFISSFFIFIAALLQFPFKLEEGWTCICGYDLSFLKPESKRCPECGVSVELEWSESHLEYSRKTVWRIRLTLLFFLLTAGLFCLGLLTRWVVKISHA